MQLTISGHHLEITEAIREYVNSKFAKLERHCEQITSTSVILTVEKLSQNAEATVHVSGAELFATSQHCPLYTYDDAAE